jgi:TRAP-type transport system periplasmic protein
MKKILFSALCMFVVAWAAPELAFCQKTKIRFGHVAPPIHGQHKGALHFKELVELNSNGRIEVSVHPAGQLGGEMALVEQIQSGTLEMGSIGDPTLTNLIPQVALFTLPFFYPNKEAVEKIWSGEVGRKVAKSFPAKGMLFLSWSGNGFRDFGNSKIAIHKPSDLASLKIRTQESPVFIESYKALGVNAAPIPWPEVFSSLQQGVVDGLDLPYNGMWMAKTYEALKYITLCGWTYSGIIFTINKKFYESLPPDLQAVVKEAAYEAGRVSLAINYQDDLTALSGLKSKGLSINTLTPEEREPFRKLVAPVHENWKKKIDEDIYNEAAKVIAEK